LRCQVLLSLICRDDLVVTLEKLLDKKKDIDYILVETNGLADPAAIVQTFWLDDNLESNVQMHATVGVIDAKNFGQKLEDPSTKELLLS